MGCASRAASTAPSRWWSGKDTGPRRATRWASLPESSGRKGVWCPLSPRDSSDDGAYRRCGADSRSGPDGCLSPVSSNRFSCAAPSSGGVAAASGRSHLGVSSIASVPASWSSEQHSEPRATRRGYFPGDRTGTQERSPVGPTPSRAGSGPLWRSGCIPSGCRGDRCPRHGGNALGAVPEQARRPRDHQLPHRQPACDAHTIRFCYRWSIYAISNLGGTP